MTRQEISRRLALLRLRVTEAVARGDYRLAASLAQDAHWLSQLTATEAARL